MLFLYWVFTISLLGLLVAGVVEQRRHEANLRRISSRVLVNGIRGKSSITRLCAGAVRGGGLRVVAKTTGSAARLILPDGTEEPIYRKFDIANVVEQVGIVRRAAAFDPDALVMECMAVAPPLQEVNQKKLIQSTIGVVCNVREDHLTEMGPTLEDVARSLSRSMPVGGVCVTAERDLLHILAEEAARRKCELITVGPDDVSDEEMAPFRFFTFKENVAIALAVAQRLGVSRSSALEGMWGAAPDPGGLTVEEYHLEGKIIRFANVFAANDPASTVMNVEELLDEGLIRPPIITLINCRPDRIERNAQMGEIVPRLLTDKLILIGHPTKSAKGGLPRGWAGEIIDLGGRGRDGEDIFRSIVACVDGDASVVAVGNLHGQGELLLEHLETLGANR